MTGYFSGCALNMGNLTVPNWREPACVLPAEATLEEIVAHLNQSISRVHSWRSTDVRIRAGGMPMSAAADIAVESPRNFRLLATAFGVPAADFGSNSELFWFWTRQNDARQPKHVFFAHHDQLENSRRPLPIPFQPNWLMETLGVVQLNASDWAVFSQSPDAEMITLVSERVSAAGQPIRRMVVVDMCRGHIVAHEMRDAQNQIIAKASLKNYQIDGATGIAMPHQIVFDWPRMGMVMTLNLGRIEVNPDPSTVSEKTWEMQTHPGYPPFNLANASASTHADHRSRYHASEHAVADYASAMAPPDESWQNSSLRNSQPGSYVPPMYETESLGPPPSRRRRWANVWSNWAASSRRLFRR